MGGLLGRVMLPPSKIIGGGGWPPATSPSSSYAYAFESESDIIVRNASLDTWKSHFNDWSVIFQTLICVEMV